MQILWLHFKPACLDLNWACYGLQVFFCFFANFVCSQQKHCQVNLVLDTYTAQQDRQKILLFPVLTKWNEKKYLTLNQLTSDGFVDSRLVCSNFQKISQKQTKLTKSLFRDIFTNITHHKVSGMYTLVDG